jgi:large subunit ribosomal protein L3
VIRGLLGKKIGMTQIFDNEGIITPVTVVEAGPCTVLGLKENPNKIVLGYLSVKENKLNKPQAGFFKKNGITPTKRIREFSSTDNKEYKVGQEIKADLFKAGDFVDVTGTSIGKGFQGGMVRWNWSGGPAAHGSMHHRRIGSNSASSDPSRTYRGHHMPGHMGMDQVTVQGLRVMKVEADQNLVLIKGAVPGCKNGILIINLSKKRAHRALDVKIETVAVKRNPMKQSKAAAGKTAKK